MKTDREEEQKRKTGQNEGRKIQDSACDGKKMQTARLKEEDIATVPILLTSGDFNESQVLNKMQKNVCARTVNICVQIIDW